MIADLTHSPVKKLNDSWLDKPVTPWWPGLTIEKLVIILILIITVFTRFSAIGARTMSHDETNHVSPSYSFESYIYDPVTHGPFQFHTLAFTYFLFGDSDYSSRLPYAVFGVAVVVFAIFAWRRYLGRIGSLIAGFLFMISPYIMFYSRYTRNEIFIVFWGMVMLWLFLRYLESGEHKWLYWLTFITAMHYVDKATSYIFSAEALIFLALLFIGESLRNHWKDEKYRRYFQAALVFVFIAILLTGGLYVLTNTPASTASADLMPPALEQNGNVVAQTMVLNSKLPLYLSALLVVAAVVVALVFLVKGMGIQRIRLMRSFDLLAIQLILILPLMDALVLTILGVDPLDYSQAGILRSGIVFTLLAVVSIFLGLAWNKKVFLRSAAIFWGIFVVFYTSFFTHGDGFFKGIVGALGYWMSQQAVQRGTQPLYYYALVQIPVYEYLPALGAVLALVIGAAKKLFFARPDAPFEHAIEIMYVESSSTPAIPVEPEFAEAPEPSEEAPEMIAESPAAPEPPQKWYQRLFTEPPTNTEPARSLPTLVLLLYWSVMSLLVFTIAGERMPWLTTHITMPMILAAAWGLAYVVEHVSWQEVKAKRGWLVVLLTFIFFVAFGSLLGSLLGNNPPFQGRDLAQLQATSTFLLAFVGSIASAAGLFYLLREWKFKNFFKTLLLSFFVLLSVLTFRTAYQASFINYDNAKEFLVYAHSTRDMKEVLTQIETISTRLYGDKSIKFAYDRNVRYPYWWYARDFPNKYDFDANITKSLQDYPIILVGSEFFDKIKPVVGEDYYEFTYKRMWWPNEEIYRNLTFSKIVSDLSDPAKRAGLWDLWFNRDYTQYAVAYNNPSLTLATWSPSETMKMYIRKDIAAQIWEFGVTPQPATPKVDPYAGNTISLDPTRVITNAGDLPLFAPRGMAVASDGSLFVADSRNNRIVHFDATGLFLNAWGTGTDLTQTPAPAGTFNELWGVAVGPDGLVYVADTWNQRVQVFTSDGQFVRMWSNFDVGGQSDGFWGPRGIAVDLNGRVYITDTGKQRVVIFDSMGNYLTQFGGLGLATGQMDEPVGIAVDAEGKVYVADTWNNRIQVFAPDATGLVYNTINMWEVDAWLSDSLENKPFLALASDGDLYITDPDRGRIIRFDRDGNFKQLWGGINNSYLIGVASGIVTSADGSVWVSDSLNNNLLQFTPPAVP